jgi:hypothetical protein
MQGLALNDRGDFEEGAQSQLSDMQTSQHPIYTWNTYEYLKQTIVNWMIVIWRAHLC